MKTNRTALKIALAFPLLMGSLSAFALVPNPYGAISYSPVDRLYGISTKAVELEAAEQEADGNCAVIAGGRHCRVVISYRNACGALAIASNGAWGADSAITTRGELMRGMSEAFAKARAQCQARGGVDCQLEQATCSFEDPQP